MGLRLPRRARETSARKDTLHLTTESIRHLASAKVGMALGCGSGGKEQSQKSPTAQKNKKAQEGKERDPKSLHLQKELACGRIFSVQDLDLQPARVYVIPAPQRVGRCQPPGNLVSWSFADASSSLLDPFFGPE